MSSDRKTVTIIGAGPVGIEAALYATSAGFDIQVIEKGQIGNNVADWGHVRLFSPFGMNRSALGKQLLKNRALPNDDSYLTGREYVKKYLIPLSRLEALRNKIITQTNVISAGRESILKNDLIGGPRQDYRFKLLTCNKNGIEKVYYSDFVIDASGTYGNHNWIGEGGIPAVGELSLHDRIDYSLTNDYKGLSGRTVLVIGDGHSAATTVLGLRPLLQNASTKIIWLTAKDRELPLTAIVNDTLPERCAVVSGANALVQHRQVRWIKNASVQKLSWNSKSRTFGVTVREANRTVRVTAHKIFAHVGYSPDNSIYRELQIHECYASRAPMKLAAALLGGASTDCLDQISKGPDVLKNPEPNFYIIGAKSYGKNSNFLIRIGLEQIRDIFQLITGNAEFDLNRAAAATA